MEEQIPIVNNNQLQDVDLLDRNKSKASPKIIFIAIIILILMAFTMVFFLKRNKPYQNPLDTKQNFPEVATTDILSEEQFNNIFLFKDTYEVPEIVIPWPEIEKNSMKELYKLAYPAIRGVYGERFNENQKIELYRLDPTSGVNELNYAQPPNQLFIIDIFSKNVLVHELIHVFHYPGGRLPSTYEEGFARAVEIIVTQKILGFSERNFSDARLYDLYKSQALASGIGSIHSGFADIFIDRYILAAFAFSKAYWEDPEFFKKFNLAAYKKIKTNMNEMPLFASKDLGDIFAEVKPFVENIPTKEWILQQGVIDYTHVKTGNNLLIAGIGANHFQFIRRDESGGEIDRGREPDDPASSTPLNLVYYDFNGRIIDSASIFLGSHLSDVQMKKSDLSFIAPGYYEAKIPSNYHGYYLLKAQMNLEGTTYETSMYGIYPYIWDNKGIYGIAPNIDSDIASIYNFKNKKIVDVEIVGGMFYADVPTRGTYKIVLNKNGMVKYVTKDNYQVVVLLK